MKTTGFRPGPTATRRFLASGLAMILCLSGAACGQSGPLFLPAQEPGGANAVPAAKETEEQAPQEPAEATAGEAAAHDSNSEREGDEETP
jgi:predicted small lipoprotein YifL